MTADQRLIGNYSPIEAISTVAGQSLLAVDENR